MKKLIAFDPGKMTGMSVWEYDFETPLTLISAGQVGGGLDGFLEYFYPSKKFPEWDVVVCESFVLDGRTFSPDTTALKIEGVLESYTHLTGSLIRFQRNNFKAHVDNDLLKKFELYRGAQPHAMDSMRHALAYMKTSKHMPTLKHYFKVD